MFTVEKSRKVKAGTEEIWEAVTDQRTETDYWATIRDIKVISRAENRTDREVTVGPWAFGVQSRQTITEEPKTKVVLRMNGSHMEGERTIVLRKVSENETEIHVKWTMQPKDVPDFVPGIMQSHISNVTETALERIAMRVESKYSARAK